MNNIRKLYEQLNAAAEISEKYRDELIKDENDFSYQISLRSIEKHIEELQTQIKIEKDLREKEVI